MLPTQGPMPTNEPRDELAAGLHAAVSDAFRYGATTRTELLTAAVAADASTDVIQALLTLPARRYHDIDEVRGQLDLAVP